MENVPAAQAGSKLKIINVSFRLLPKTALQVNSWMFKGNAKKKIFKIVKNMKAQLALVCNSYQILMLLANSIVAQLRPASTISSSEEERAFE